MGSGAGAAEEAVAALNSRGEKVGLLKLRLFRPFPADAFLAALPNTVRAISVLDRTKEPGSLGEPLYMDVVTAFAELSEKERSDARMAADDWRALRAFLQGIHSRDGEGRVRRIENGKAKKSFHHRHSGRRDAYQPGLRCVLFNRRSAAPSARFFMDWVRTAPSARTKTRSKSSGKTRPITPRDISCTTRKKRDRSPISHLRFGPRPIESTYLITRASFIACHQFSFVERTDVLAAAEPGATFLLNSPFAADQVWDQLPRKVAAANRGKETEILRDRRIFGRAPGGHGQPHQHHHANLLLRHQRRSASRRSDRRHQARHSENLRKARRCRGSEKFCRRRCLARAFARSESTARGEQPISMSCRPSRRSLRNLFAAFSAK